jgi:hypothetical protein
MFFRFARLIIQDHLVNNLSAKDALPSPKPVASPVELLVDHMTSTPTALHVRPPQKMKTHDCGDGVFEILFHECKILPYNPDLFVPQGRFRKNQRRCMR